MPPRLLGKVPTPLEVLDTVLDAGAEVIQLPARVGSNLAAAGKETMDGVNAAIEQPKAAGEVPAPPDVVLRGGVAAVSSVVSGAMKGVGGVLDAARQTADGVRRHVDGLVPKP